MLDLNLSLCCIHSFVHSFFPPAMFSLPRAQTSWYIHVLFFLFFFKLWSESVEEFSNERISVSLPSEWFRKQLIGIHTCVPSSPPSSPGLCSMKIPSDGREAETQMKCRERDADSKQFFKKLFL